MNVSGVAAGTLGSEPLTENVPALPDTTVVGASAPTVGASAALTVTVVFAVVLPQLFVAVSDRLMTVPAPTTGAVKTGAAAVRLERLPEAGAAQV